MEAYIFKVKLFHNKRTYRTIAMAPDQTLESLHYEIFHSFDRGEDHMYSFYLPQTDKKSTNPWNMIRDADEYSHRMNCQARGANAVSVSKLNLNLKQMFYYLFDFGSECWHEIVFEGIKEVNKKKLPAVIAKKGDSPSEYDDCDEEG